jgi:glutaredoxin
MENYTLFVDNSCSSCKKIQQYINVNNIPVKTINIDNETYDLPFVIMVVPALVNQKKLIAYGTDILTHL